MERITSKDNEKIKWLIKLQNSRKARQESESFVSEGMRLAQEVLRCGLPLQQVFASESGAVALRFHLECTMPKNAGGHTWFPMGWRQKISSVQTPQGIYCVCGMPKRRFAADCRIR